MIVDDMDFYNHKGPKLEIFIKWQFTVSVCVCICDSFLRCMLLFNVNSSVETNDTHLLAMSQSSALAFASFSFDV